MTSSKREELEALIERLEKATGPDRELDAAIAVACLPQRQDAERANHARLPILTENTPGYYEWVEISGVSRRSAPKYSESIDAAIKLIPGRHGWFIENTTLMFLSQVYRLIDIDLPAKRFDGESDYAAIALCIAALRARLP